MPKRGYHHGDLARVAVTEGIAVLDAQGIEGLSASEVARRAGVTHAALYKHFGGRDDLLEAITYACFDDLRDALRRAAARPAGDPRKQFHGVTLIRREAQAPGGGEGGRPNWPCRLAGGKGTGTFS